MAECLSFTSDSCTYLSYMNNKLYQRLSDALNFLKLHQIILRAIITVIVIK